MHVVLDRPSRVPPRLYQRPDVRAEREDGKQAAARWCEGARMCLAAHPNERPSLTRVWGQTYAVKVSGTAYASTQLAVGRAVLAGMPESSSCILFLGLSWQTQWHQQ